MNRILALAAAAACLWTGVAAVAAGSGDEPPADATGHYVGFQRVGPEILTEYPNFQGFVVDKAGRMHRTDGGKLGYVYLTRQPGQTTWSRHRVPGSRRGDPDVSDLALSPNGKTLLLAAGDCGVYVVAKKTSAPNFPDLEAAPPLVRKCEPEGDSSTDWALCGMVALPHHRAAVLITKSATDDVGRAGVYVFFGRPGGRWVKTTVVPDPTDINAWITRDASTGSVYVAVNGITIYSHRPGGSWSMDKKIDPLVSDNITGLASMRGQVWLAYQQSNRFRYQYSDGSADPPLPTDGVYLTHRSKAGDWSEPSRPFGTDMNSLDLRLLADPEHRTLLALYSNADSMNRTTTAGIYFTARRAGTWAPVVQLTHWWVDVPMHLATTPTGDFRYDFFRDD